MEIISGEQQKTPFHVTKGYNSGNPVLLAFRILIMDTDTHRILSLRNKIILNPNKAILIGDFVWIGCYSVILKGTEILNHSIIGAGAVV